MTKTKHFMVLSLIMALITLFSTMFCLPASAASGKSKSYSAFTTKVITVTTNKKGSPSITFKSVRAGDGEQMGGEAPFLSLKVYNHSTRKTQYYQVKGTRWFDSVTSTLKLNANTKYTITVSYLYNKSLNWGSFVSNLRKQSGWYDGDWQISATKNLSYSIK